MTDEERFRKMAQEQMGHAADQQVFGRDKRVAFHRQRAALFRSGAQALRTKAALLESLEPDASPSGPDFLEFIADRLVTHGDSPQADFVLALRRKAGKMRAALSAARENP